MKLKGKVAIVTGGANGIGRAIALRFAREGAHIVVVDTDPEQANEVVKEIEALKGKAIATQTDVRDSREVNQMVEAVLREFDKIDILVNNAGGTARDRSTLFHECPEDVWDFVIDTNLKGTFLCTKAVLKYMMPQRSGRILSTSSTEGVRGSTAKGGVEYSAVKAGIIGFTKSLAKQVGQYGITVNCYSPGAILTRAWKAFPERCEAMQKRNYLGRLGEPNDVANMACFLASDEASWITGQNFIVDGGDSLGW